MADSMTDLIQQQMGKTIEVLEAVRRDKDLHHTLAAVAQLTADAMLAGHKLIVAGNGGSAADSQHLVAEFVNRLVEERPAMRAIALTVDSSILTAIGNDYGYEFSFSRQIEALGQKGDVFLAISTSGNSPNLLRALKLARSLGIITIGLTGHEGGLMKALCDWNLIIPGTATMNIQEAHLMVEHIFCLLTENCYFGRSKYPPAEPARADPRH